MNMDHIKLVDSFEFEKIISFLIRKYPEYVNLTTIAEKVGMEKSKLSRWKHKKYPDFWDYLMEAKPSANQQRLKFNLHVLYSIVDRFYTPIIEDIVKSKAFGYAFELIYNELPRKVDKEYLKELMKSSFEFFNKMLILATTKKDGLPVVGFEDTETYWQPPFQARPLIDERKVAIDGIKDRFYESELIYLYHYCNSFLSAHSEEIGTAKEILWKKTQINSKIKEYLIKRDIVEFITNNETSTAKDIINQVRINEQDDEKINKLLKDYKRREVKCLADLSQGLDELLNFLDKELSKIKGEGNKITIKAHGNS